MQHFQKVLLVLFVLFSIRFIPACLICENHKYYDYNMVDAFVPDGLLTASDTLAIDCAAINPVYMASLSTAWAVNMAYGYDCVEGWGGMKFPIEKIIITSDADFDDNHPANTALNDLFFRRNRDLDFKPETGSLDLSTSLSVDNIGFYLPHQPTKGKEHVFTIQMIKSNRDTIRGMTQQVVWE